MLTGKFLESIQHLNFHPRNINILIRTLVYIHFLREGWRGEIMEMIGILN
jgi:hypothetical protein